MSLGYPTPPRQQALSTELRNLINERNILTTRTRMKVLSALEDMSRISQEEKQRDLRSQAIKEILTSEASYLHHLEVLMKYFMEPLKTNQLISPDEWALLFGHIDTIYSVNGALLEELKEHPDNVSAAFLKLAPYFKLYSLYAYEYKHIVAYLQEASKKNPSLATFLKNQESRPEVGMKLTALLIVPIQRIPRYRLLLREVLSHTSHFQQDYYTLQNSLQEVERTAEHINELVQEQENTEKILKLQTSLRNGRPGIITPGRKLLKQGVLMKVSADGRKSFPRYFVLFSDMLMYCTVRAGCIPCEPNSLICRCILPLKKCTVQPVLSEGVLRISCAQETIIVYSSCVDDTRRWMTTLQDAMKKYLSHYQTLRKDSSSRRPMRHKELLSLPPNALGHQISLPSRCRKRRLASDEASSSRSAKRSKTNKGATSKALCLPAKRFALRKLNRNVSPDSETPRRKWDQTAIPLRSSLRNTKIARRADHQVSIMTPGGSVTTRQKDNVDGNTQTPVSTTAGQSGSVMNAVRFAETPPNANDGTKGNDENKEPPEAQGPWASLGNFVLENTGEPGSRDSPNTEVGKRRQISIAHFKALANHEANPRGL